MREIKFRAYLKKHDFIVQVEIIDWNEKYIVHEDLNSNFHDVTAIDVPDNECVTNFEDFVLMQYTGLKDKNGKEIYEGDVLSPYEYSPIKNPTIVQYDDDLAGFYPFIPNVADGIDYSVNNNRIEIIGNIYENPELLESA